MPRCALAIALLLLFGCDPATPPEAPAEQTETVRPAVKEAVVEELAPDVLAEVNGESIRQFEIEVLAREMFGRYQAEKMDETARQRLLDSLISSLALAQRAANELPAERLEEIDAKTRRYRENLLISEYLSGNAEPEPITEAMILDYYQNNLEQFGAGRVQRYELVTTRQPLALDQRRLFLERVAALRDESSLERFDERLRASGFDTRYQTGLAEPDLLPPRLHAAISAQPPGRLSEVIFIDDSPYLLLVGEALRQNARPLAEVRGSIRRTLMAAQVKGIVKELSESVRQQATIRVRP